MWQTPWSKLVVWALDIGLEFVGGRQGPPRQLLIVVGSDWMRLIGGRQWLSIIYGWDRSWSIMVANGWLWSLGSQWWLIVSFNLKRYGYSLKFKLMRVVLETCIFLVKKTMRWCLGSTGADLGLGVGVVRWLGKFWKIRVWVRRDTSINKLLNIFFIYIFYILVSIFFHIMVNIYQFKSNSR